MILTIKDDFNLDKIAKSGQCFRWRPLKDGFWKIPYRDRLLTIGPAPRAEKGPGKYQLSCTQEEFDHVWYPYFDFATDYRTVRGRIDEEKDPYLYAASQYGRGIRILSQDPWEILITFIISQRKNIPAIRQSVEALCQAGGEPKPEGWYTFPSAEALDSLSDRELGQCHLGYRQKYIRSAARLAAGQGIDFDYLKQCSEKDCMEQLTSLYGVGVKVASCTALYGLHRLDFFPKDVWIGRVLERHYGKDQGFENGFPFDLYRPYNGIMQQYLFEYERNNNDHI
jgi:N-glycosylase/DNA lyase